MNINKSKSSKLIAWDKMNEAERLYAIQLWGEKAPQCSYDPVTNTIIEKYGVAIPMARNVTANMTRRVLISRGWTEKEIDKMLKSS